MNASIREYKKGVHRFFDNIALFLTSFSTSLVVTELLRTGRSKLAADSKYYMQFSPCSLPVQLTWYPQETLALLAYNNWPSSITLHENLTHPPAPIFKLTSSEIVNLQSRLLQSCLLTYFEEHRSLIEAKYGTDPWKWPMPWNFARVVRNAFAHGGVLTYQNPSSKSVTWRALSYDPSQSGRQIIFMDLSFVEVVSLMEDLDELL